MDSALQPGPIPPQARRGCDGCTACCTVLNVPQLNSPAYESCRHLCAGGCGIHESRPEICRGYFCEWAIGNAPEWMKPNLCGVIPGHAKGNTAMHLHEVWPGASESAQIREFIRLANSKRRHVVVTLHPGAPPAAPDETQRNRIDMSNGEVRDFAGLRFTATILAMVPEDRLTK